MEGSSLLPLWMAQILLKPKTVMKTPIRIMFVEDDPEMCAIYTENFLAPEFQAATATNGQQALEVLLSAEENYDVIVTDNYMPEMDGITLLRKIRENFPDVKVVIVTGYGNWKHYIDAHNLGVCKFVDKPVKMAELKELVRSLSADA